MPPLLTLLVSEKIAPVTAVVDRGFNGYRDLILPFAEFDPFVRKAVVLVSKQHISLHFAVDVVSDINAYNELIQGLIARSHCQDISSMTVLLLLHIREVISGSSNFKLVYSSLRALVNAAAQSPGDSSQLTEFVNIQILRYETSRGI